jgi:hypothetical protein
MLHIGPRLAPRTKFSEVEDWKLRNLVRSMPRVDWTLIGKLMGNRTPRQCRERYQNYLDPSVRLSPWSPAEEQLLLQKQAELGAKWAQMTQFFPNRTAVAIKNHYAKISQQQQPIPGGEVAGDQGPPDPPTPIAVAREAGTAVETQEPAPPTPPPPAIGGIANIFQRLDRSGEEWFAAEATIKFTCHMP